jgi:diacylglycerol kinase (ATP)
MGRSDAHTNPFAPLGITPAMPRRPLLLIVNPAFGGKPAAPGSSGPALDPSALRDSLHRRGLQVQLHVLAEADDVAALAAAAVGEGHDVVAAGGDGTVRPAAGALVDTDATLGTIPLGSWNNLARGWQLPLDEDAAMDLIADGPTRSVDVGLAWHPDRPAGSDAPGLDVPGPDSAAPADAIRFFEAAGVGLDAAGFGAAEVGSRRGAWHALRAGWRAMRRRRTRMLLTVDGRGLRTSAPAVTVCNGPYYGFGFALAPLADPSDGELDLVVFSGMSTTDVVVHYLAVARGRPRREPRVKHLTARRIEITGLRRLLPVHADGESLGMTPIAIGVHPTGLRIFGAPPQLPGSPVAAAASAPKIRA